MNSKTSFSSVSAQLEEAYFIRERVADEAFSVLEKFLCDFAAVLTDAFGSRSRAVRWMSMHHKVFEGRNAYQVIADGETDVLWEEISRTCGIQ